MLRYLFNEPKRVDSGLILQANQAITLYINRLYKKHNPAELNENWKIWVQGFATALDELEQSIYCACKFAEDITHPNYALMNPEEKLNYHRYLYFYKNSFVRVFAILDKLGFYLNKRLELNTEKVKPRFSYFTMLRQMRQLRVYTGLEQKLYDLKQQYRDSLHKLRIQRNMEIHSLNYENINDLRLTNHSTGIHEADQIDNLAQNRHDLDQAFEMICLTIAAIFTFKGDF